MNSQAHQQHLQQQQPQQQQPQQYYYNTMAVDINSQYYTDTEYLQRRRKRTPMACTFCRGRKLKCDGKESCTQCTRRGLQCTYVSVADQVQGQAPKS